MPPNTSGLRRGGFTPEQLEKSLATRRARAAEKYGKVVERIAKGERVSAACKGLVQTGEFYKKLKEDPEFAERVREAEAVAAEPVEDAVYEAALGGNVPAQKLWLEKRSPERWPSDKKLTVESKHTLELEAGPRLARILALQERLADRLELSNPNIIDVEVEDEG